MLRKYISKNLHLLGTQSRMFASAAAIPAKIAEKDYYKILNVETYSTPEQIKDAYRTLAKKHHPDVVAANDGQYEPDVEKFRAVVEAYGVLSVRESRAAFDITRKKNPDMYSEKGLSDEQFDMYNNVGSRDKRGVSPRTGPARRSYAEQRMAELKLEREKYNVNDLGFYRGGVPRPGRGPIRGAATGAPGAFHSPAMHNFINGQHPDTYRVTPEMALQFKHFMGTDQVDFQRTKPAYTMTFDTDFNYQKNRAYWLHLMVFLWVFNTAINKYYVEVDRNRRTARQAGFKGVPAHHFNNRGGVVVMKEFAGFQKYWQNQGELDAWRKDAYKF